MPLAVLTDGMSWLCPDASAEIEETEVEERIIIFVVVPEILWFFKLVLGIPAARHRALSFHVCSLLGGLKIACGVG